LTYIYRLLNVIRYRWAENWSSKHFRCWRYERHGRSKCKFCESHFYWHRQCYDSHRHILQHYQNLPMQTRWRIRLVSYLEIQIGNQHQDYSNQR